MEWLRQMLAFCIQILFLKAVFLMTLSSRIDGCSSYNKVKSILKWKLGWEAT